MQNNDDMSRPTDNLTQSDHHNARGIELADRGWYEEAIREFHKAIELDPNSAHAHDNLGTVLAEKGLLLEALEEFVKATQLDPTSATTHHYLASFLASHGADLAIAQYRRAIACEFEFPDAHLNLAITLADNGRLEEALRELEVAHVQAPDDPVIEHELACCLIDLDRHPDAIAHLK
ncbi:MAG: tetratricopeptide repeat protein, partial [Myxococcota bacterium]|nr:tetratricopeptide repeat protein [Myxococcota bacterium]